MAPATAARALRLRTPSCVEIHCLGPREGSRARRMQDAVQQAAQAGERLVEQKEEHVGWCGAIRNREKACAKREAFVSRTRPRGAHDWCLVMRNVGGVPSCL